MEQNNTSNEKHFDIFPGEEVEPSVAAMEVKHTLHLVAYDIANPKRLRRIAKLCEVYGLRVEKSVFEADLSDEHFNAFWQELQEIIDVAEDSVVAYTLCKACVKQIISLGQIKRPTKEICYCI